jgi:vacuolar-type H+-ATPase subunit F/Vma7
LDTKTEVILKEDIILNFGNIGCKTIFELDDHRQKRLLDKLIETGTCSFIIINEKNICSFVLDNNSDSILQILADSMRKDAVRLFFLLKEKNCSYLHSVAHRQ